MIKRLAFGIAASFIIAGVAIAGMWSNFPIVGSASYSCGSVNGVSNCTVPAGPINITGNETIPADTNLTAGQNPQTVLIKSALIGGYNTSLQTGVAITYTVANTITNVVLSHTTTIDSAAITAPANPIDGQRVKIGADHTVTAFSFVANTGQTLSVTTPTVLTASTTVPAGYEFIYVASTAKWYRLM